MPVKKGEITTAAWTETVEIEDNTFVEVQATKGNGLSIEIYNAIRNTGALDSIDDITKVINQAEIDAGRENVNEDGNPDPIIIDPIMGPDPEKQEESNLLWTRISSSIADAVIQHMTVGGNDGGAYYDTTGDNNVPSGPLQTHEAEDQIIFLKNQVKSLSDELQATNMKIQELVLHLNATNLNISSLCNTMLLEAAQRTATQALIISAFIQTQADMEYASTWIEEFVTTMGSMLAAISVGNPMGILNTWNAWLIGHATLMTSWDTSKIALTAANTSLAGVAALDLVNYGLIGDDKDTASDNADAATEFSESLNSIIAACESIETQLATIQDGDADNVV